jgi:hypothetical protein
MDSKHLEQAIRGGIRVESVVGDLGERRSRGFGIPRFVERVAQPVGQDRPDLCFGTGQPGCGRSCPLVAAVLAMPVQRGQ